MTASVYRVAANEHFPFERRLPVTPIQQLILLEPAGLIPGSSLVPRLTSDYGPRREALT